MKYVFISESNVVEVLRYFIATEETNQKKYEGRKSEFLSWRELSDAEFLHKIHVFSKSRSDINPTIVWTIGTSEDRRYQNVARWILADVYIESLYTSGINSTMMKDLDSVQGNLKRFVEGGYASKYDEFNATSNVAQEFRTIIGVAHTKENRDGKVELVDGAHRIVNMIAQGHSSCRAYIAELRTTR